MRKQVINSSNILQYINSYNQKFSKYGIGSSFFGKLKFPDNRSLIGKKIIEVQLKEDVTRQSMESNLMGYTNLLNDEGFPASFNTTTTSKYEIIIKNHIIRFLKPKREQKTLPTEIQEKGAVFIFNQSLKPGVSFNKWQDIMEHKETREGLEDIFKSFGEVPENWIVSYFKQEQKLFKTLGKSGWDKIEYKDSDSVMSKIKELIKKVTIDSKNIKYENWNPSDIWLVKNKNEVFDELEGDVINSNHSQTLKEVNDKLLKLIKENRLVGVSLKKVPARQTEARFVYVNTTPQKSISFGLVKNNLKIEINLNLKYDVREKDKMVESTSVKIGKYSLQIKSNSGTSSDSNLKFESGSEELGGRGGKAPLDYVSDLMKDYKIGRLLNDWKKYPATKEDFMKTNSYERIFSTLRTKTNIKLGVTNYKDFYDSIVSLYSESDQKYHRLARTKLMEMVFIYQTTKLNDKKYEDFWKDLIYLSIKEGPKFSPHGKLY